MSEAESDTSYSRLTQESKIKPKVFYDKDPIRGERHDGKIDYKPTKVAKIKPEKEI